MYPKFSYYYSAALENGVLIKDAPGVLYSWRVTYLGVVSPAYLQFHDAAAAPADATVATGLCYNIASTWFDNFDPQHGWEFENGLYICGSSTAPAKTILTDTKLLIYVQYL